MVDGTKFFKKEVCMRPEAYSVLATIAVWAVILIFMYIFRPMAFWCLRGLLEQRELEDAVNAVQVFSLVTLHAVFFLTLIGIGVYYQILIQVN